MTSISSLGTSSVHTSQQQTRPAPKDGDGGPLASVSSLLGSSVDDLRTELATGKSLDDIATEKGVSHDDLLAALKAGAPADAPSGTDALERMAARAGGPQPPPATASTSTSASGSASATGVLTGSLTDRQQNVVDQLSDLLGTDSDDLVAELQGGTSLLQMLQDKGITRSDASSTVGEGFLLDSTS